MDRNGETEVKTKDLLSMIIVIAGMGIALFQMNIGIALLWFFIGLNHKFE